MLQNVASKNEMNKDMIKLKKQLEHWQQQVRVEKEKNRILRAVLDRVRFNCFSRAKGTPPVFRAVQGPKERPILSLKPSAALGWGLNGSNTQTGRSGGSAYMSAKCLEPNPESVLAPF